MQPVDLEHFWKFYLLQKSVCSQISDRCCKQLAAVLKNIKMSLKWALADWNRPSKLWVIIVQSWKTTKNQKIDFRKNHDFWLKISRVICFLRLIPPAKVQIYIRTVVSTKNNDYQFFTMNGLLASLRRIPNIEEYLYLKYNTKVYWPMSSGHPRSPWVTQGVGHYLWAVL